MKEFDNWHEKIWVTWNTPYLVMLSCHSKSCAHHGTPCHSKWFESRLPRWALTTFKDVKLHLWFQIMKMLKAVMDCRWFCLQGEEVQPVDCFVQEGILTKALVIFVSCVNLLRWCWTFTCQGMLNPKLPGLLGEQPHFSETCSLELVVSKF